MQSWITRINVVAAMFSAPPSQLPSVPRRSSTALCYPVLPPPLPGTSPTSCPPGASGQVTLEWGGPRPTRTRGCCL